MKMDDIRNFLSEASEEDIEHLRRIIKYEDKEQKEIDKDLYFKGSKPWWRINDTLVPWQLVKKLQLKNILIGVGGRRKVYNLADRGKVKQALSEYKEEVKVAKKRAERQRAEPIKLHKDLFDVVEEFDDLLDFIRATLTGEEPVHVLLVGPPGTAKSLILKEIERLGASYVLAGSATKVGIRDLIFDKLPRILIVDEVDKVSDSRDIDSLLSWMEEGRIIVTKHDKHEERGGVGWVFGAANSLRGVSKALQDRFQIFHIKPYTKEQYIRIVSNYLMKRRKVPKELAEYIAERTADFTNSVRQAIRVSRMAKTKKKVDWVISVIKNYKEEEEK